jgi:hypothetical protein
MRAGWLRFGLIVLVAGCAGASPSVLVPSQPTAIPVVATTQPPTDSELAAIRFRQKLGLQADLDHVRAVANDPTASHAFNAPLLPAEIAELDARNANAEANAAIVRAEAAAAPDDYCGVYIDQEHGGALTSMWRANLEGHAATIVENTGSLAQLAFVDCTFSEQELKTAKDAISAMDWHWMDDAIPARLQGVGLDTIQNRVRLEVSSANPDAAELIATHYQTALGLPDGMLTVTSDRNGSWLVPWGNVEVTAVDWHGKVVHDVDGLIFIGGIDPPSPGLVCSPGDIGYTIGSDGTGETSCQVGRWTIVLLGEWSAETGSDVLGSAPVTVREGKTARVTIEVDHTPYD